MIRLALEGACLPHPRCLAWCLVLHAGDTEPACAALPELCHAYASETWAGSRLGGPDAPVAPFWVAGVQGAAAKEEEGHLVPALVWGTPSISQMLYLCSCPASSQGRWGFSPGGRRSCKPGRARGTQLVRHRPGFWVWSASNARSPAGPISWNFLGKKPGRGLGAKTPPCFHCRPSQLCLPLISWSQQQLPSVFPTAFQSFFCLGRILSYLFWELFRRKALWNSMLWFQSLLEHPWFMPLAGELHADSLLPSQDNLMGHFYPMCTY